MKMKKKGHFWNAIVEHPYFKAFVLTCIIANSIAKVFDVTFVIVTVFAKLKQC